MALKIFNTLSRSVEAFEPLDPAGNKVGMYCCGPTVHDFAHIGNFRTFVFTDLFRRYLEFQKYDVRHVMNITDVEDKIIRRVRESGTSLKDYTAKYEQAFFEDLEALGCLFPHERPHAVDTMDDIIGLIKILVEKNVAYRANDGSVYFSIERYQQSGRKYGQLLNLNFEEMRPGERVDSDEYDKESIADFALWKSRVPEDGDVFWESPWGEGRPGWHIECSAMSMKLLGHSFDVHLGGEDLVFPHHEDEIAQSEASGLQECGHRFVKYWMHGAHLLVEGKKMSKSLGNFFTLRDLLDKGFSGREIRYLLISAHYRETFNFTLDGLVGARKALTRIDECMTRLAELAGDENEVEPECGFLDAFANAMNDDLNVSATWGAIFEKIRELNSAMDKGELSAERAAANLSAWNSISKVLGIESPVKAEVPAEIVALAEEREAARMAKDFARSDAIRDELKAKGWVIEDTPKGKRLKKL